MIRKVMMVATAAGAAVVIAILGNQVPQTRGSTQAGLARVESSVLTPGEILSAAEIDFIESPGRYGLGSELRGSRYAIVDGHLVRVDPQTMELQSILRKYSVTLD